jgi:hypothetical protein
MTARGRGPSAAQEFLPVQAPMLVAHKLLGRFPGPELAFS